MAEPCPDTASAVEPASRGALAAADGTESFGSQLPPGTAEQHRLHGFRHVVFHHLRRQEAQWRAAVWLDQHFQPRPGNPQAVQAMRG